MGRGPQRIRGSVLPFDTMPKMLIDGTKFNYAQLNGHPDRVNHFCGPPGVMGTRRYVGHLQFLPTGTLVSFFQFGNLISSSM